MRMRFKPYAHDELMAADFHVHEPLIWGGKWHAQYARPEQPFVLGLSANRLNTDFPEDETVLIQGIIDVYLEEEDGIVLADYKTDLVKDPKELILRYRVQLDYYEEALVRLTGKCVKEKLIYSFGLEQEITL